MSDDASSASDRPSVRRKLAAIFAADVAEFSRLIAQDEEGTLLRLADHRQSMDAIIAKHGGRIANTAGDSVLAEFESSVEAVRSAVEVQEALRSKNSGISDDQVLQFRIGINVGDVIAQGGDLLGDGVNVAARLEALAEPGGICLSSQVREQIEGKLTLDFVPIGRQRLKNIPKPVEAYKVADFSNNISRLTHGYTSFTRNNRILVAFVVALAAFATVSAIYSDWPIWGRHSSSKTPEVGVDFNDRELEEWAESSIERRKILERGTFEGHAYALVHAWGVNWMEAEAEARAMGGHLVAIGSQAENDFLVNMIAEHDEVWHRRDEENRWLRRGPWIGFVQKNLDDEPAGGWEWSNGEPVVFVNWFGHAPDNYDGLEHAARFRQFSDRPGIKWDDGKGRVGAYGYLVEFENASN